MLNKRKIIVINPKFQFKISIMITVLVVLSACIFPLMIFDLFEDYTNAIIKFQPAYKSVVLEKKEAFVTTMLFWELGFIFLIFTLLIFITHRIAGPIYKLQKFLTGIREGGEDDMLFFRKGDYFMELADDINSTIEYLKKQNHRTTDEKQIEQVIAYIKNLEMVLPDDKKVVLEEIISKLSLQK